MDHFRTDVLKKTLHCQLSYLVTLVNSSFAHGIFPLKLGTAVGKPLLKKDNLDHNVYKNYRPVPNIFFISKVLEKVAVKRLTDHVTGLGRVLDKSTRVQVQVSEKMTSTSTSTSTGFSKVLEYKYKYFEKYLSTSTEYFRCKL